jgi:L-lysine exporter family protein LysE/ArgO
MILAFVKGAALGASLIACIGAQNAFVLRQGLSRAHVLAIVLTCALSDALLISMGAAGLGALFRDAPTAMKVASVVGALYLIWFGIQSIRRAWKVSDAALIARESEAGTLRAALLTTLALTYLNPHVYLDTVVLLGSMSARELGTARVAFALGAICTSFVWFFTLGFGARLLAPLFRRPVMWRLLDGATALVMFTLAGSLMLKG